jgi:hypothetical protein
MADRTIILKRSLGKSLFSEDKIILKRDNTTGDPERIAIHFRDYIRGFEGHRINAGPQYAIFLSRYPEYKDVIRKLKIFCKDFSKYLTFEDDSSAPGLGWVIPNDIQQISVMNHPDQIITNDIQQISVIYPEKMLFDYIAEKGGRMNAGPDYSQFMKARPDFKKVVSKKLSKFCDDYPETFKFVRDENAAGKGWVVAMINCSESVVLYQ